MIDFREAQRHWPFKLAEDALEYVVESLLKLYVLTESRKIDFSQLVRRRHFVNTALFSVLHKT